MTASTDVESQSAAARSRCRCLDAFLTVSVIALFIMFAGALWFALHIENKVNELKAPVLDGSADSLIAPLTGRENAHTMQNVAYLRASESELRNGTVRWESIAYGNGSTVGSLFDYNEKQSVLKVKNRGSYFLYVQLSLSCTGICQPGRFTVSFEHYEGKGVMSKGLTCTVSLPKGHGPVSRTCWRVVTFLENDYRLMARSELQDTLGDWQLQMNESGFGMFLVDGVQAAHHT